jgi:hypothetical protein
MNERESQLEYFDGERYSPALQKYLPFSQTEEWKSSSAAFPLFAASSFATPSQARPVQKLARPGFASLGLSTAVFRYFNKALIKSSKESCKMK